MFRNVIVGVDEHQGGRDAAALAKHLLESGGRLTFARVSVRDALIGRGTGPEREDDGRRSAVALHTVLRDDLRVDAKLRYVFAPSVGRGLHELAEAERADLLVVGSCRRGRVGRALVGDDTSDALNGSPCAVAVAPFGYAESPTSRGEIGVAYDGSPESINAVTTARSLAARYGAKLSAFQAVDVPPALTMPGAGAGAIGEAFPALVAQARERIVALGDIEPHAAYGLAIEELPMYSASLDLLVVGSRGYGPIGRFVHGSVSRQLARTARCPLLILPRVGHTIPPADLDDAARLVAVTA